MESTEKNVMGYYIYRKVGNGSYKLAATIKKGRTASWTDTKVTKGRKYQYYICAYVKEPKRGEEQIQSFFPGSQNEVEGSSLQELPF